MSVRIYQLSKEIGMENADLIALLKERGYEVKSASSTIDNISAESLREEFAKEADEKPGDDGAAQETPAETGKAAEEETVQAQRTPSGAIVRSKEDIERERREREEAEAQKREASAAAQQQKPQGKAPPPLPRKPQPQSREAREEVSRSDSTYSDEGKSQEEKGPVLRTDLPLKPAEPAPSETEEKESSAAKASSGKGPPTLRPPMGKGPKSISPPKISPPKAAPPKAPPPPLRDTGEEQPDELEGGEEAPAAEETEKKPELALLQVKSPIVVRDFAVQIGKKPFQLISELMELGIFASMNSTVEEETATRIAKNHGYALEVKHRKASAVPAEEEAAPVKEKPKVKLEERPPIVCVLGHVDHGKTTLLDTIRKTNVVSGEAGGITQHIGAYQVEHNEKKITFIDTPGHAAFSNMRARGANTTDIAVLVVAADDGFMPQTDEALGHARVAKIPVVVAINKMDVPGANVEKVYRQMQERELMPEEWGGETLSAKVSAISGDGIENLLEAIVLQTEVTEGIDADPKASVEGVVLEAQKELGRGSTASVIIQSGTLKPGTALVCGEHYCRVRQIIDDKGQQVKEAGPSTPVKIVGWSGPPDAGDIFKAVKNERTAKKEAEANELERKQLAASERHTGGSGASVEDLFAAIEHTQQKKYRVVVKADVYGTAEALATSLINIKSDKIELDVVEMGVGDISKNDVLMASASNAAIIGFNVGVENGVPAFAKHHSIEIIQHDIIYELINTVKDKMADLLEPELREDKIGAAEVREVFPLAKGFVAGCMVTEGRIHRDSKARIMRKGEQVHESKIGTLKRFKEDATEVRAGYECGIQLTGFNGYERGDIIEVLEITKVKPNL